MRKEVLLAILIGAALGGLIAFGVWRANLSLKKVVSPSSTNQDQGSMNQEPNLNELSISEPEEGTISPISKVVVKGRAMPGSIIAVLSPKENVVVEAKSDGTFEAEVTLEGGVNEIRVTSVDPEGKESTKTMIVVYSTEFQS